MRVFVGVLALMGATGAVAAEPVNPQREDFASLVALSDVKTLYPAEAQKIGLAGEASVLCTATAEGRFADCKVEKETPAGYGFAAAVAKSTEKQQLTPQALKRYGSNAVYRLTAGFNRALLDVPDWVKSPIDPQIAARAAKAITVPAKDWAKTASHEDWKAAYPSEAVAGPIEGAAELLCQIGEGGWLTKCVAERETNPGHGFVEAMISVAQLQRLKPAAAKAYGTDALIRFRGGFAKEDLFDTLPDWVKRPSGSDLNAVWPKEALAKGLDGSATVACTANIRGALEQCKVIAETPLGVGFGSAALLLAPAFLMKPATLNGRPVPSTVRFPVTFKGLRGPTTTAGADMRMLPNAPFDQTPSYADLVAAWPKNTPPTMIDAQAGMRCKIQPDGRLSACEFTYVTPPNYGFERAARELAKKFHVTIGDATKEQLANLYTSVPIHFINPGNVPEVRHITHANWVAMPDPNKTHELFPDAAVKQGIEIGTGTLECAITAEGGLIGCKTVAEAPANLGFGEAALVVSSVMKMSRWSDDGTPTGGAFVRLPIRIAHKPEPAAVAAAK